MKRILRYVLLCTMLAGCDHQEMSLQAHHWEAKRQGFDQEEIESLIREPESLNKVNRQLKNKEVASFFWLGMTKEEIRPHGWTGDRFFSCETRGESME
ncbi:hypothetical protein [Geobacillus sp. YF-1]|uniref:hypothetical protein n=1 Tax=Geobacillus sp. YF-1 TaxID=3457480 RepID=UPI0040451F0C